MNIPIINLLKSIQAFGYIKKKDRQSENEERESEREGWEVAL